MDLKRNKYEKLMKELENEHYEKSQAKSSFKRFCIKDAFNF